MIKMLKTIREKMLDSKTKRAEKQFAQLREKNEKLVRQLAASLEESESDKTLTKPGSNSGIKSLS